MAVACSMPTFLDYRRDSRSFASLSATRPADFNVAGDGEPERVRGLFVSADFFETLGVAAARGRTFLTAAGPSSGGAMRSGDRSHERLTKPPRLA